MHPRVVMTARIPIDLYDLLMAETAREGISQNEVVVRALRSALETDESSAPQTGLAGRRASAQTQVLDDYVEESVASPCCGADIQVNEGRRFCSDCGTLVPS
jgi:hypothetical protein